MKKNILVNVDNVYKAFKTVKAVNGLSFSVKEGEFLALLGPNGAGKTTMVEIIEGLQQPDRGSVTIDGLNWSHHAKSIHSIIGISLQETRFIDKLRVQETLKLFASFYQLGRKRVNEVIEIVGLEEKRKAFVVNLSGGQRQRLALGIALLNQPRILLLDEPTTGLDPAARREVWNILKNLRNEAKTSLILTTHYMEEAEQLCDNIIIIDHGVILREGSLDKLLRTNADKKIVEFKIENDNHPNTMPQQNSTIPIQWTSDFQRGSVEIHNLEKELPELLAYLKSNQLTIENLEMRKLSLDDLFIQLTGRHLDEN